MITQSTATFDDTYRLREAPVPYTLRLYQRFPVHCAVTYHAGPFEDKAQSGISRVSTWRLSGDLPMRPGETLPLTVTLPNNQRIEVPEAVVRWSRGQEFAVENVLIEQHNHVRLQHYVNRLVREPERMSQLVLTAPNGNRRPF